MNNFLEKLSLGTKINFSLFSSFIMIIVFFEVIQYHSDYIDDRRAEIYNKAELFRHDNMRMRADLNYLLSKGLNDSINGVYDKKENMVYYNNILKSLKGIPDFQNSKVIISRIELRLLALKDIFDNLQDEMKKNEKDGFKSVLALYSANALIYEDGVLIEELINKYLASTLKSHEEEVIIIKSELILFAVIVFLSVFFINRRIVFSIKKNLNDLNENMLSFLDFIKNKNTGDKYIKINASEEVGQIINTMNDNIGWITDVVSSERKATEKLEKFRESLVHRIEIATKESREAYNEVEETQKELLFTMGAITEERSKETSNHVKRVAEYSMLLARLYGLSKGDANKLKFASPMHDIGKVAIPDNILKKEGGLTITEFEVMKTHTKIGYEILRFSQKSILKAAATIAYEHHEKFNGSGYPRGLKGEEIHIFARITALADVFDALGSSRSYKKAWEMDDIIELIKKEKGKHFDPILVDLFLNNIDMFINIRDKIDGLDGNFEVEYIGDGVVVDKMM